MKLQKIQIDLAHSKKLLRGEAVAIKVPKGSEALQLRLTVPSDGDSFVKLLDVFFNGRPA